MRRQRQLVAQRGLRQPVEGEHACLGRSAFPLVDILPSRDDGLSLQPHAGAAVGVWSDEDDAAFFQRGLDAMEIGREYAASPRLEPKDRGIGHSGALSEFANAYAKGCTSHSDLRRDDHLNEILP